MAEEQQTEPEADEWGDDVFGRELAESIKANKALLKGLKYAYGQQMIQAQAGDGDYPDPLELAQLKKLEREIQNDEMFAEARLLTRKRSQRSA